MLANMGLSPRVRGNLYIITEHLGYVRSIPACAGEPGGWRGRWLAARVYPRVCGGTSSAVVSVLVRAGLSPRVRGNLLLTGISVDRMGSIPACAGEPQKRHSQSGSKRVYPRVCGGTGAAYAARCPDKGLSPRVRGNLPLVPAADDQKRSIPACAGEPFPTDWQHYAMTVYPRVCGGTVPPPDADADSRAAEVYPRVCGGTRVARQPDGLDVGLSPRVRGNQRKWGPICGRSRSIPACAGEPHRASINQRIRTVYPRVCGGTNRELQPHKTGFGLSPRVRGNPSRPQPAPR